MNGNGFVSHLRTVAGVYGEDGLLADDPAETFHEASKAYPRLVPRNARGVAVLEASAEARATTVRAVKRHAHRPALALPEPQLPRVPLAEAIARRATERRFGGEPLPLAELAALLHAAYGVTHSPAEGRPFRSVPSGGALYPLELYVLACAVEGVAGGVYHFDPLRRVLELLGELDRARLADALIFQELLDGCAAVVVVTAMFWRTRFKYGLRGYRFALLEAGHLAQNLLLVATALGLSSAPVGGFYDRRLDELLGVDGVNESSLYTLFLGGRGG